MTNELAMAAAMALSREVGHADTAPLQVTFSHQAPADVDAADTWFQCPVVYGAQRDGIELGNDALRVKNRLGDAKISEFFDAHLDRALAEFVDDSTLEQRALTLVTRALSEGAPRIADIAGQLAMSPRTLQRRLDEMLSELRAPGANLAALGALMFAGLFRPAFARLSLTVGVVVFLAFAAGRSVSLILDGTPSAGILVATVIELAIGLLCLATLVARRNDLPRAESASSLSG